MQFLYNLDTTQKGNHNSALNELVCGSKYVLLVSPFVAKDINDLGLNFSGLAEMVFVTNLPSDIKLAKEKVDFLLSLSQLARDKSFALRILEDENLHAKVYVAERDGGYKVIVTSANMTHRGLRCNDEMGVIFSTDLSEGKKIIQHFCKKRREITESYLLECQKRLMKCQTPSLHAKPFHYPPHNENGGIEYWLKPCGFADKVVPDTELYLDKVPMTFATRPSGIRPGDIIICYAAGRKDLLSVLVAKGDIVDDPTKGHLRYCIECYNLTPQYGRDWSRHHITLDYVKQSFIKNYVGSFITPSGRNDYKRLTLADKMKVTETFARYVLSLLEAAQE